MKSFWFIKKEDESKSKHYRYIAIAFIILLIIYSLYYLIWLRKKTSPDLIIVFDEIEKTGNLELCNKIPTAYKDSCIAHYYATEAVKTNNIDICNNIKDAKKIKSCMLYYAIEKDNCSVLHDEELKQMCIEG